MLYVIVFVQSVWGSFPVNESCDWYVVKMPSGPTGPTGPVCTKVYAALTLKMLLTMVPERLK